MLTCPTCDRELQRVPVARPTVQRGAIAATVEGLPRLSCPEGHDVSTAVPDAAGELLDEAGRRVVAARRTKLRKQLRCGACDEPLTIPGRRTERVVSARIADLGVVRVVLDVPMMRCPECGVEQLPEEVAADDLGPAIRAAAAAEPEAAA